MLPLSHFVGDGQPIGIKGRGHLDAVYTELSSLWLFLLMFSNQREYLESYRLIKEDSNLLLLQVLLKDTM